MAEDAQFWAAMTEPRCPEEPPAPPQRVKPRGAVAEPPQCPEEPPRQGVELFSGETRDGDCAFIVRMAKPYRYLEKSMAYGHPGALWASLCAAAPRRLPGGGSEYAAPFPRPASLDEGLPPMLDGGRLPPGRYLGTISLTLSNPTWRPAIGERPPGIAFVAKDRAPCAFRLVLDDLRPVSVPDNSVAGPTELQVCWSQLKAAFSEAFFPDSGGAG